jgi:hypothetical protein
MTFKPFRYDEIEQIQDALTAIKVDTHAEPLIRVNIERVERLKEMLQLMGFEILKTGSPDIIRFRNFEDGCPDFHIFY